MNCIIIIIISLCFIPILLCRAHTYTILKITLKSLIHSDFGVNHQNVWKVYKKKHGFELRRKNGVQIEKDCLRVYGKTLDNDDP